MTRRTSHLLEVVKNLKSTGIAARTVSIEHLGELKADLDRHRSQDLLDPELERRYLHKFEFVPPKELPSGRTLIVAAAPQPSLRVGFTRDGRTFEVIVPPTYVNDTDDSVRERIEEILRPAGFQVVLAYLPEKLLLVRSGLGCYGKNNVVYVDGTGSFQRPVVFITDAETEQDHWYEARMLDKCEQCIACYKKCPTGAISSDRFLLRAERCLTFFNESDRPFPKWVDPAWHSCLVGCMVCQDVCPENKPFVRNSAKSVTFNEAETDAILRHVVIEDLPGEAKEKLLQISLLSYYDVLPRNLGALLKRE